MWESKLPELQELEEGQRRGLGALQDSSVPLPIPKIPKGELFQLVPTGEMMEHVWALHLGLPALPT